MTGPGFRFDMHVHTRHSRDGRGTVAEIARQARRVGLHGFAVTDHDTIAGHQEIAQAAAETGQTIIPGIEVTTASGHLLALGVDREIPWGQGLRSTIDRIRHAGGVAVPAHPLRMWTGIGPTDLREGALTGHVHAAEGVNGRDRNLQRENVLRLLASLQIPALGGSDAHAPEEVGTCWTVVDGPIDGVPDVLDAIRRGACEAAGGHIARSRIWAHRASMLRRRAA